MLKNVLGGQQMQYKYEMFRQGFMSHATQEKPACFMFVIEVQKNIAIGKTHE